MWCGSAMSGFGVAKLGCGVAKFGKDVDVVLSRAVTKYLLSLFWFQAQHLYPFRGLKNYIETLLDCDVYSIQSAVYPHCHTWTDSLSPQHTPPPPHPPSVSWLLQPHWDNFGNFLHWPLPSSMDQVNCALLVNGRSKNVICKKYTWKYLL